MGSMWRGFAFPGPRAAGAPEIGHNGNAEGDASDAGMVFALVPGGATDATMEDIKNYFMKNTIPHSDNKVKEFDPAFAHTVYFWLKNPESASDREKFVASLNKFLDNSKYAKTGFVGVPPKASRDVVDGSFTYSLIVSFESAEAQEKYQKEEAHTLFIKESANLWDKVIVYDSKGLNQ